MGDVNGDLNESRTATATPAGEPQPEPIRFFGTTWVRHDGGYGRRRAAVAAGSLLAAVVGGFALRFGFQGLAGIGVFVTALTFAGFAISSALAFRRTWLGFTERRQDAAGPDPATSTSGLYALGFVGSLLAYFLRALTEAPGEGLHRAEYEAARAEHDRRRTARSGDPATADRRKSG